ncbi:MAG: polysaccharide biosynthesis/export family protein [Hyphomicrobiaceae bacterium]|nr:polysaccharide biosynthesis/export family protein [Hyphomicrobiaceae bacterium]
MRWYGLPLLLSCLALLAGCANAPKVQDGYHPELVSPYRLDAGDRIRVIVFGQADLSNTYVVDQAGNIAMPLIGTVQARGRSTAQIEADVSTRLKKGYLRNPDVSVEIDRYRPFFAMGEVGTALLHMSDAVLPGDTIFVRERHL